MNLGDGWFSQAVPDLKLNFLRALSVCYLDLLRFALLLMGYQRSMLSSDTTVMEMISYVFETFCL